MDDVHVPDLPDELPPLPPGVAHIDVAAMTHEEAMALSRRSAAAPCAALLPRGRMPGIPADREALVTGARARRRIPCAGLTPGRLSEYVCVHALLRHLPPVV
jgi:hypothetical protein